MFLHSVAIKLQATDYNAYIKPVILIALSFSEIAVCIITVTMVILPCQITMEEYQATLPYFYCVKLIYVAFHIIMTIDYALRVQWNITYNPYKMTKMWKTVLIFVVFLFFVLFDNTRNRFSQRVPLQIWAVCRIQSVYYNTFQLYLFPHKDVQQAYASNIFNKTN